MARAYHGRPRDLPWAGVHQGDAGHGFRRPRRLGSRLDSGRDPRELSIPEPRGYTSGDCSWVWDTLALLRRGGQIHSAIVRCGTAWGHRQRLSGNICVESGIPAAVPPRSCLTCGFVLAASCSRLPRATPIFSGGLRNNARASPAIGSRKAAGKKRLVIALGFYDDGVFGTHSYLAVLVRRLLENIPAEFWVAVAVVLVAVVGMAIVILTAHDRA